MMTDPDDLESAKPVYRILSVAAPFVGFLLGMTWAGSLRGDSTGAGGAICLLKIMPLAVGALGIYFAVVQRTGCRWCNIPGGLMPVLSHRIDWLARLNVAE